MAMPVQNLIKLFLLIFLSFVSNSSRYFWYFLEILCANARSAASCAKKMNCELVFYSNF